MADCIHMTREMAEQCPICRAKMDVKEVSAELTKTFSEALEKTLTLPDTLDMIPRAQAEADKQLAVAAALREAAEQAASVRWTDDTCGKTAAMAEKAILALIPDAGAALDRALAAERERCVEIAWLHFNDENSGDPSFDEGWDAAATEIAHAIRAQGEDQ